MRQLCQLFRMNKYINKLLILLLITVLYSCREDQVLTLEENETLFPPREIASGEIRGFYVLNEGNMGTNKSTLDFVDFEKGIYRRNIYAEANPTMLKELGDVGNDIGVYGSKLWATINCSHFIEVDDVNSTRHLAHIDLENCRYLEFYKGKVYASSYAGPVEIAPDAPVGKVVEIDTTTYQITREVAVGYQPEEILVHNGKLYVANSGGYRVPDYDNRVSIIDLESFKVIKELEVGINLHRMAIDSYGDIYVSSRGDYYNIPSKLFVIDSKTNELKETLDIPVSNMFIVGDSLYYYSTEWSYQTSSNRITYGILNTKTKKKITDSFITDGSENQIKMPYGIAVHPVTREIYVTDARNYISSGYVLCYSPEGILKWRVRAGNIPAHFAFVYK